jgi:GT2 family glycosyltransferase
MKSKIAILMTCFNRKGKTFSCLTSLFENRPPSGYKIDVYLVDDGSSDGTTEMVKENFPTVKIIQGDGSLFWNRGMKLTWSMAMLGSKISIISHQPLFLFGL